jgi:molybdate-binding protein/DNA-binding XRE family transcriptional regulator
MFARQSARSPATVRAKRRALELSAANLAKAIAVSRQTIYAIESGTYIPNAAVAIRLAKALETTVEELFPLEENQAPENREEAVELICPQESVLEAQPVRVCRVGQKRLAFPAQREAEWLPEADGVVRKISRGSKSPTIHILRRPEELDLVLAGCDSGASLLVRPLTKAGIRLLPWHANSSDALTLLRSKRVHVAGCHLESSTKGGSNVGPVKRTMRGEEFRLIRFVAWEQGLLIARGNPKAIRGIRDLGRRDVLFANREEGAGTRRLFDRLLKESGISQKDVAGYQAIFPSHIAAARAVLAKQADCCLAPIATARTLGLDFIPLATEHYDFVTRSDFAETKEVETLFDIVTRGATRRMFADVCGYETGEAGKLVDR